MIDQPKIEDETLQPTRMQVNPVYSFWIGATVVALALLLGNGHLHAAVIKDYAFDPSQPLRHYGLTLLTATLLHADFHHLFSNLLFYFIFAPPVESALGFDRFLKLLLVSAIVANAAHGVLNNGPVIGASGVIWAILVTFMRSFPDAKVRIATLSWLPPTLLVQRYSAWLWIGLLVIFELWETVTTPAEYTQVSLAAHAGGILVGLVFSHGTPRSQVE